MARMPSPKLVAVDSLEFSTQILWHNGGMMQSVLWSTIIIKVQLYSLASLGIRTIKSFNTHREREREIAPIKSSGLSHTVKINNLAS